MASNGVILLNLNNRNAADFQRLEVPDSYEKASGALTAGTYVTVYKWLYQGFMVAPSLCDAVDATDHINLVDRTNGGILEVYPDDTITIPATPEPEPEPSNPEFNMGGVDFVGQSFGPSNIMSLISSAVEESFIVMATNFSVEGDLKGATPTSVSKFTDMENTTFYTMENKFFKYSASENPFGQAYRDFHIKEE